MMSPKVIVIIAFLALGWSSSVYADGYSEEADTQASTSAAEVASNLDQAAHEPKEQVARLEIIEGEKRSAAVGHFARARSHLIAALREFDSGYKIAKPDSILNSEEWREDLISRAEDLERILAPQARASKYGVRYEGDPRLLSTEAKER